MLKLVYTRTKVVTHTDSNKKIVRVWCSRDFKQVQGKGKAKIKKMKRGGLASGKYPHTSYLSARLMATITLGVKNGRSFMYRKR